MSADKVYDACGQTPTFFMLTRLRPEVPFIVFADRPVHDELAVLFTVLFGKELERMRLVPPGLDVWRDVRFEISDDVPANTIVFATRAREESETAQQWFDSAALAQIVNLHVPRLTYALVEKADANYRVSMARLAAETNAQNCGNARTHGLPPPLNAVGTHRTNGHPVGCRCEECDAR